MLKGIGGVMIFVGCLGLGVWYRGQLTGRVRALRLLKRILELLSGEIRYGRATLPECCRHTAAHLPESFGKAMQEVDERMRRNNGDTFPTVFCECMRKPLSELPLREEDREDFLGFVFESGFMDSQMQLQALERSCRLLADTTERLQKENVDKCRMAVGLGVMGGLLLILVLW